MMGREYRCTHCDFEFCSGWSHHAGGQFVVCPTCGVYYILGGGRSVWDPADGETLHLIELREGGDVPTGISVAVRWDARVHNKEWNGVVRLVFDDLSCPRCGGHEKLIQSFGDLAACPQCKSGRIEDQGSCIY